MGAHRGRIGLEWDEELIAKVDAEADRLWCSRTALMNTMLEWALMHMPHIDPVDERLGREERERAFERAFGRVVRRHVQGPRRLR
jgi:hypothetical protein